MNTDQMFFFASPMRSRILETHQSVLSVPFTVMGKAGVAMTGMLAQGSEALKRAHEFGRQNYPRKMPKI